MSSPNPQNILLDNFTSIVSLEISGKENGFAKYLSEKQIPVSNEYWAFDHSFVNWKSVNPFFQFNYDSISEAQLIEWLSKSRLIEHDHIFTWLDYNDSIIQISTSEFIDNWRALLIYSGWEGMVLTTEKGELFLEFTDDWKTHLNSNFAIKP
jgi:hypothetical protein